MQNITLPKVDGVSDQPAAEMNSVFNELQNVITTSGQALAGGDLNQIGKSSAIYAAGADFYVDTGAANAYVLTPIGSKQSPPAYYDGMRVRFLPTNTNTAASTVAVNGLAAKNIVSESNKAIIAGQIEASYTSIIEYVSSLNAFVLLNPRKSYLFKYTNTLAQSVPPGALTKVTIDLPIYINSYFNTVNSRFLPLEPGYYLITTGVFFETEGVSDNTYDRGLILNLILNGTTSFSLAQASQDDESGSSMTTSIIFLNGSTDYVEAYVEHDFVSNQSLLAGDSSMFGIKIY